MREDGKKRERSTPLYRKTRTAPTVARHELNQCLARIVDGELSVDEEMIREKAPNDVIMSSLGSYSVPNQT